MLKNPTLRIILPAIILGGIEAAITASADDGTDLWLISTLTVALVIAAIAAYPLLDLGSKKSHDGK